METFDDLIGHYKILSRVQLGVHDDTRPFPSPQRVWLARLDTSLDIVGSSLLVAVADTLSLSLSLSLSLLQSIMI